MIASLPAFTDYETFRAWRADPAQWLPIALDIARSHGLACTAPHVFATGTNLVIALDEKLILKIFPPFLRRQFVSERGSLAQLRGRLRDRDPRNRRRRRARRMAVSRHHAAVGRSRRGSVAVACRKRTRSACSPKSARPLPRCSALPVGALARIEPGWDRFMRGQIEGCRARHERLGLPQKFLDGLDELLRDAADADSAGQAAGDPDRRIHSGEFPAEPRRRRAGVSPGCSISAT